MKYKLVGRDDFEPIHWIFSPQEFRYQKSGGCLTLDQNKLSPNIMHVAQDNRNVID